jgi:hypothetical protein
MASPLAATSSIWRMRGCHPVAPLLAVFAQMFSNALSIPACPNPSLTTHYRHIKTVIWEQVILRPVLNIRLSFSPISIKTVHALLSPIPRRIPPPAGRPESFNPFQPPVDFIRVKRFRIETSADPSQQFLMLRVVRVSDRFPSTRRRY